jgi:hypothetical protein
MNARIGCPARSLAWDLGGAARCPELRGKTSWPTLPRLGGEKIGVKVIRHKKIESFAQENQRTQNHEEISDSEAFVLRIVFHVPRFPKLFASRLL